VKVSGYPLDGLRGEVREFFLDPLENGNKVPTVVPEKIEAGV